MMLERMFLGRVGDGGREIEQFENQNCFQTISPTTCKCLRFLQRADGW